MNRPNNRKSTILYGYRTGLEGIEQGVFSLKVSGVRNGFMKVKRQLNIWKPMQSAKAKMYPTEQEAKEAFEVYLQATYKKATVGIKRYQRLIEAIDKIM